MGTVGSHIHTLSSHDMCDGIAMCVPRSVCTFMLSVSPSHVGQTPPTPKPTLRDRGMTTTRDA